MKPGIDILVTVSESVENYYRLVQNEYLDFAKYQIRNYYQILCLLFIDKTSLLFKSTPASFLIFITSWSLRKSVTKSALLASPKSQLLFLHRWYMRTTFYIHISPCTVVIRVLVLTIDQNFIYFKSCQEFHFCLHILNRNS